MKTKWQWLIGAGLALLFVVFTVVVKFVDVAVIGPMGASVGLSSINGAVNDALGESKTWLDLSDVCCWALIGAVIGIALAALIRLIKYRKIEADFWILAAFYALVVIVYIVFEVAVINYRPVPENGELAPSYPSSHTLIATFALITSVYLIDKRVRVSWVKYSLITVLTVAALLTAAGRLLAGVHWLTDVVGALLIGGALGTLYIATVNTVCKSVAKRKKQNNAEENITNA